MISKPLTIVPVLFLILFSVLPSAQARPVSYPGAWTVMTMNDADSNSSHIHYSPTARYSLGWQHDYFRISETNADTLKLNYLIKRWNRAGSQANMYLKSGAGIIYNDGDFDPALYTGLAADWETRRLFTSYENRFFHGGDLDRFVSHRARIGVAPYLGDYGDLHTWLMLQADYDAGLEDSFSVTPLVRFFKGPALLEAGINFDGGGLFNFVYRF